MISIILPSFNEEASISSVIDDIRKAMGKREDYEIIVVDDCSSDGTSGIAAEKGAVVIKHIRNKGSGASRKTGIMNCRGDVVVMLDADGTYPASAIPELLAYFPDYDQVIGARRKEKGTFKIFRSPAKWFLRRLAIFLTGQNIDDLNSGLRAFRKEAMMRYLYLIPNGFSCVSTMTISFLCDNLNVKFVPINYYKRTGGKSKFHPVKDTKAYLFTIIRITMNFNPLRVILPVSIIIFLLAIAKTIYDMALKGNMVTSTLILYTSSVIIGIMALLADLIVVRGKK